MFCALALLGLLCACHNGQQETEKKQRALPEGVEPVADGYGLKDSVQVYYLDSVLHSAHARSFRVLSQGYAADDSQAWFHGVPFEPQQAGTLRVLGGGYAADAYAAYYNGREVQGAQAGSFRWVAGDTAADVTDTYIKGLQQPR